MASSSARVPPLTREQYKVRWVNINLPMNATVLPSKPASVEDKETRIDLVVLTDEQYIEKDEATKMHALHPNFPRHQDWSTHSPSALRWPLPCFPIITTSNAPLHTRSCAYRNMGPEETHLHNMSCT